MGNHVILIAMMIGAVVGTSPYKASAQSALRLTDPQIIQGYLNIVQCGIQQSGPGEVKLIFERQVSIDGSTLTETAFGNYLYQFLVEMLQI